MEISKMIACSTLHVTPDALKYLDSVIDEGAQFPCPVYGTELSFGNARTERYGYLLHCSDEADAECNIQCIADLIAFARDLECEWLWLNADAEVYPYLTKYRKEWGEGNAETEP